MRTFLVFIWALLSTAAAAGIWQSAAADDACLEPGHSRVIENTLASAGFFANLRYSEDSIHYQMDQLLDRAKNKLGIFQQKSSICANSCAKPVVGIVFSSHPRYTLDNYSEADKCQKLFELTSKDPIVYKHRLFKDDEEAKEWYNDLSRGSGEDGEDLYDRCDGSCSPQYSSFIWSENGGLAVTTSIICGHARDKDDDQYVLSSALRAECP